MASPAAVDPMEDADEGLDMRQIGRSAGWIGLAMVAVIGAVAAARSDSGLRRISEALDRHADRTAVASRPGPPAVAASLQRLAAETQRLSQTVQALAADRDRILQRLAMFESAADVTGSVAPARKPDPPKAAPAGTGAAALAVASVTLIPPPQSEAADPGAASMNPGARDTKAAGVPGAAHKPQDSAGLAAESRITRTQFGVDLGAGADLDALRSRWETLKGRHMAALEGLQPLVAVRETASKGIELHLIAGPLANAAAAARLCAALADAGAACQPGPYDGQTLSLR